MNMPFLSFAATLACVALLSSSARADDKAEQISRDAAGLGQVKTIAMLPAVVQLKFDKEIPDPNRVAHRFSVADRLPDIVEEKLKKGKFTLMPFEAAALGIKEKSWTITDMYSTKVIGTRASPADTIKNRNKDQADLLASRTEMIQTPDEMTVFSFTWHGLRDAREGLACFRENINAKPDMAKLKQLNEKLHADALLLCQVTEMESHDGVVVRLPIIFSKVFSATSFRVHCMLIRPEDGAILWEAEAKGRKEVTEYKGATNGDEGRMALAVAGEVVEHLLSDLTDGTGVPSHK
jgi:hypothetical protein